jgi:site-specific DNA-methyltransferase (adenine-specific)
VGRAAELVCTTELGRLARGDALAWLPTLPAASVDLVFADPPYNIGKASWDNFASDQAYLAWSERWIGEAARVLKPSGSIYVCGFSERLADLKPLLAARFPSLRWLVWHYRNKANLGRDWGRAHESVLHARGPAFALDVDAAREPYNAHTLRYPAHPQAVSSQYGRRKYLWRPHPAGAKPRDVIEAPTLSNGMREKTAHPTQKPLEVVRRLVVAAAAPGALVVDPFGGAGTTFVVCEREGRRWLGCELDPGYCTIAAQRIARAGGAESDPSEARKRRAQRAKLR